jgi:hypothetical protein
MKVFSKQKNSDFVQSFFEIYAFAEKISTWSLPALLRKTLQAGQSLPCV